MALSRGGLLCLMISAWLTASAMACHAAYTGLIQIPTARCLDVDQYEMQFIYAGQLDAVQLDACAFTTQFGLVPRIEAGVDFNLTPHTGDCVFGNVKYVFAVNAQQTLGAAAGVYTWPITKGSSYVVVTADIGSVEATIGATRIGNSDRWMLGFQQDLSDRYTLMSDYISGPGEYAALGVQYFFSDRANLLLAAMAANRREGDTAFFLQFTLLGPAGLK